MKFVSEKIGRPVFSCLAVLLLLNMSGGLVAFAAAKLGLWLLLPFVVVLVAAAAAFVRVIRRRRL